MLDRIIYLIFFIFYLICMLFNFNVLYLVTVLVCAGSFYLMVKVYTKWFRWIKDLAGKGKLLYFLVLRL